MPRLRQASSPSRQWAPLAPLPPLGPRIGGGRPPLPPGPSPSPAARSRRSSAGRLPGVGVARPRERAGSVAPCLGLGQGQHAVDQRIFAPIAPPKRRSRSLDGLLDEPDLQPVTVTASPTPAPTAEGPGPAAESECFRDLYLNGSMPDRLCKSQSCDAYLDLDDVDAAASVARAEAGERRKRGTSLVSLPPSGSFSGDPLGGEDPGDGQGPSDLLATEAGRGRTGAKRNFVDRCMNKMRSLIKK